METYCFTCQKKFGGFINVIELATPYLINTLKKIDPDFDNNPICTSCMAKRIKTINSALTAQLEAKKQHLKTLKKAYEAVSVFTTPAPENWDFAIKGIVSGHSVVGTGPISSIAASFTDFFGTESEAYLKKIRIGEKNAILRAKIQALELGATDICGANLRVTEASSGHGMLMISFVGTAILVKSHVTGLIEEFMLTTGEIAKLSEKLGLLG